MEKDPVPGSAVPVHTLHGLYDHALAQAPRELTELFQLSKKRISSVRKMVSDIQWMIGMIAFLSA